MTAYGAVMERYTEHMRGRLSVFPGPDHIVTCPGCGRLTRYMTLMTATPIAVRAWTDGKVEGPLFWTVPPFVKCPHCGSCFWLRDAREVGVFDRWNLGEWATRPQWRMAELVQEPSEEDYYRTIETALPREGRRERELRLRAWWRRNDALRDFPLWYTPDLEESAPLAEANMRALLRLMKEEGAPVHELVVKADLHRHLGEFEEAKAVLGRITNTVYTEYVLLMRILCDQRDPCLREVPAHR